ncbi:MAG: branched-chain amino acid ABC transporter permease [Alphaproteobacteria bacterium]|nr:branched-chain amino acid ABC transporter permease [Alphaproteobacteria bacterium]
MRDTLTIRFRPVVALGGLVLLLALPLGLIALDQPFYVVLATRILIYALIASSLNLLIGYGGMVSFGHAAFVGAGAYAVAVLVRGGVTSAWLVWTAAMLAGGLLSLLIGAVSLRTRGVYFIMITLAFAQMAYYLVLSLKGLGSDDGLNLPRRPTLGLGLNPRHDLTFYYAVLALFAVSLLGMWRLLNAPLGRALQGIRDNEARMEAIGFPVYRLKLAAFVVAGALAGLGGGLLATLNGLVSPSLLHWTQSGTLMIMVILGGAGQFFGGVAGAVALLLIEEVAAEHTIHWPLGVGVAILAVVLFAPSGLAGLWRRARFSRGGA